MPDDHPIVERPEWLYASDWAGLLWDDHRWRHVRSYIEFLEAENEKLQNLDPVTMDRLILHRMHRRKEEMIENKEHLSDYSSYAILEELIKIFTDLEMDHQKELSEVSTDA